MIDSQLHLLDPLRFPYDPSAGGYVPRDDETGDLAALLQAMDEEAVARGVLVQPSSYGLDNAAILDALERQAARFRAVVMAGDRLSELAARPGVVGARLNLANFAAHGLAGASDAGGAILAAGLILQVLARPSELSVLVPALPAGPLVVDHLGFVDPAEPADLAAVAALAARPDTWLKLSGGFRLGGGAGWPHPDPGLRRLVAAFPENRLLWGSDWPFINLPGPMPTYRETLDWGRALVDLDRAAQNAAELFGFDDA